MSDACNNCKKKKRQNKLLVQLTPDLIGNLQFDKEGKLSPSNEQISNTTVPIYCQECMQDNNGNLVKTLLEFKTNYWYCKACRLYRNLNFKHCNACGRCIPRHIKVCCEGCLPPKPKFIDISILTSNYELIHMHINEKLSGMSDFLICMSQHFKCCIEHIDIYGVDSFQKLITPGSSLDSFISKNNKYLPEPYYYFVNCQIRYTTRKETDDYGTYKNTIRPDPVVKTPLNPIINPQAITPPEKPYPKVSRDEKRYPHIYIDIPEESFGNYNKQNKTAPNNDDSLWVSQTQNTVELSSKV